MLFVGIVLISNGISFLTKADGKSIAFLNVIVGFIIVIGNLITLGHAIVTGGDAMTYNNIAAGLLFGITYLFIAGNFLFKLDLRNFGLYCAGASVFAVIMSIVSFIGGSWPFGVLWAAWFVLWFSGTVQFNFKAKFMEKAFPYIAIIEGLFAALLPAVLLLMGWWVL